MPGQQFSRVLEQVTGPRDLDRLSVDELNQLAEEIRHVLIRDIRQVGGHLGPNAGVVELTIGLHRVFDSPRDPIIFDVGHQSYIHKMLTGRQDLSGVRQQGGLSGYPNRDESAHDVVESSHAASALSWGVGLAQSFALKHQPARTVVVVLGDGSLTGGTTWEALNNISPQLDNLVVVLNDNGVSYGPTVGSVARALAALRDPSAPLVTQEQPQNLFTQLGLTYLGPVDGHDITDVEHVLDQARKTPGPVLVHVITEKARGVVLTEAEQHENAHTVPARAVQDPAATPGHSPSTNTPDQPAAAPTRWTEIFGAQLCASAATRTDVVALSAAMVRSTGLAAMAQHFPDRVFDVGIAEQHAVTAAAGMAYAGFHPVVAVYSTFLTRAVDQIIMDVALHRAPVTFVLDRAGVTGPDGPSHHGQWDLSLLSTVPGIQIAAPRDRHTLKQALTEALESSTGPTALRFPTGEAPPRIEPLQRYDDGAELLYTSGSVSPDDSARGDVMICVIGPFAQQAIAAAQRAASVGIRISVVDPRWVHPMPSSVFTMAQRHRAVLTVEDGVRSSGIGAQLAQALSEPNAITGNGSGSGIAVRCLGLPNEFIEHGTRADLLAQVGLTETGMATAVQELAQFIGKGMAGE